MSEFVHQPVLLNQAIEGLKIKPCGIYADGTLGGGGHSSAILQELNPTGLLIGIDRDGSAIAAAEERLTQIQNEKSGRFLLIRGNHDNIKQILEDMNSPQIDGFLLDLGVSSHQLDTPERGFSYRYDAPLDMRMDTRNPFSAYDVVNGYSERELVEIIFGYGEERYAKRIAKAICKQRPIETTMQLTEIITAAVPAWLPSQGNPAGRTFQAIRIAVNEELTGLKQTIEDMVSLLKPGGRLCIISFHSLEDRIVKQSFKHLSNPCKCPRDLPYCVCGKEPVLKIITKKPIRPDEWELEANSRAHSAKLRIAERM